jgi:hypothetical protein
MYVRYSTVHMRIGTPVFVVAAVWLGALAFAAWAAFFPVYWSQENFVNIVSGPWCVRWPNASSAERILAGLLTVALIAGTVRFVTKPSGPSACILLGLTAFWLLLGLAATFAWV